MTMTNWTISREELDRIRKMAADYIDPPEPRTGDETNALYDRIRDAVMANLPGLLTAADLGIPRGNGELFDKEK